MEIHGNKLVFGFRNLAYFNREPAGDLSAFWTTREERDAALAALRSRAVSHGLSESASRSGIYPVQFRASEVRRAGRPVY
jgi:hypothetical protein